jgi:signal transduction histidine kinase
MSGLLDSMDPPRSLRAGGLVAALLREAGGTQPARQRRVMPVVSIGSARHCLPPEVQAATVWITREGLANAWRRPAQGLTDLQLLVDVHAKGLRLELRDGAHNPNGLEVMQRLPAFTPLHGSDIPLGVPAMHRRALAVGAHLSVRWAQQGGTWMSLSWQHSAA